MIKFQNTWRFWLGCLMFAQIQSSPVLSDLRSRKRSDFIEEDVEPTSHGTNAQTFQDGNLNRQNLPLKGPSFKFADPIVGQAIQPFNDVKSRVLTRIHRPDDPKFQLLLQRIRPIIGNETKLAFRSMQSNRGSEVEVKGRPEKVLFFNVLTIMKNGLQNITGSKDFDNYDEITDIKFKIENCLEKLNAGTLPAPEEVSDLARRFNDLFQTKAEDSDPIRNRQAEDPNAKKAKAPFCDPGQDCFEDVDHEEIALEVNRLAKSLANYIKSRANQDQQIRKTGSGKGFEAKVKFKTDAVLTEITAILARLHRSVLRNWHHILMILNNMAGEGTIISRKMYPGLKIANLPSYSRDADLVTNDNGENFYCGQINADTCEISVYVLTKPRSCFDRCLKHKIRRELKGCAQELPIKTIRKLDINLL